MKSTEIFPRVHMSYYVSDLEQTIQFYTKFFDIAPVKIKAGYAKFLLTEPSLNISFIESDKKIEPNFIHFGIEVNDEKALKQKLGSAMKNDLSTDHENEVSCCYAKQNKFWVTDPDGYRWEVFHRLEDVEQNDEQYAKATNESACCEISSDQSETACSA